MKNFWKRVLAVSIALMTVVSMMPFATQNVLALDDTASYSKSASQNQRDFTPILRFAVTSDIHLRDSAAEDYGSRKQLAEFMRTAYAYSDAQSDYSILDGLFFVGDITQTGSKSAQTYFFKYVHENLRESSVARAVMGNHEFYSTGYYTVASFAQAPKNFMTYSGYDSVDAHLVIKGYHFIFLSMDAYDYTNGIMFTDKKLNWLENELAIAAADDETGTKPIFVFQHEPPEGAVGGAIRGDGDIRIGKIFAKYPQVVDFCGHTHQTIAEPNSIMQDTYTTLNTGSLAYITAPIAGHPQYDSRYVQPTDEMGNWVASGSEEGIRNGGMYYIVEVDANSKVRVQIYDIFTDSPYGDPIYLDGIGDPEAFTLTKDRKAAAQAPIFAENAAITLTKLEGRYVQLQFPQASATTDPVQNYRLELYRDQTLVDTQYYFSGYYYGSAMPEKMNVEFHSLTPETTYTLKVYAVNGWGRVSSPLSVTFDTLEGSLEPDILSVEFKEDGSAINTVDGSVLNQVGNPTVAFRNEIGQYVGVFGGSDCYLFNDIDFDQLSTGFSLEAYVLIPKAPASSYVDLVSGQESGGFGFEYESDGKMYFYCNVNGSYKAPSCNVVVGEYAHLVATFDGKSIKMYLNGVLKSEVAASGTLTPPVANAQYLCIGADPEPNTVCEHFFTGEIVGANLYSFVLTEAEIKTISNQYHVHSYSSSVTAPTCTEQGYTTYTCACGESYVNDYVDATDHTATDWIVDLEPQAGAEGSKHKECEICGETLETDVIEALPEETENQPETETEIEAETETELTLPTESEEVTAPLTDTDDDTKEPDKDTMVEGETADIDAGGCSSVVAFSVVAVMIVAVMVARKKDN